MNQVVIPIRSAQGVRLEDTLQFLRAEIRRRHRWGSFSMHGGGGGSRFEAGYDIGANYPGKDAWISLRLLVLRNKERVEIEITDRDNLLSEPEPRDFGNSLFVQFFELYYPKSTVDPAEIYGRWRSGLFHAGRFARIDGAHAQIDFVDDSEELDELYRIPEAVRRSFSGWIDHIITTY